MRQRGRKAGGSERVKQAFGRQSERRRKIEGRPAGKGKSREACSSLFTPC